MSGDGGSFSCLELPCRRGLAGALPHLRRHDADPRHRRRDVDGLRLDQRPGGRRGAVEFARTLAGEAQKFADEVERMHAAQHAARRHQGRGQRCGLNK